MTKFLILLSSLFFSVSAFSETFILTSSAFNQNGTIPAIYSCQGKNVPPPLNWSDPPPSTQSFALIMSTPDAGIGGVSYDWVLYNIPPETRDLRLGLDNLPEGTLVGKNSYGDATYAGPCPPDSILHHHVFTLYALDAKLELTAEADIDDVLKSLKKHVIKQIQLIGTFRIK